MHLNKLNARRKSFVLCLIGRGRGKWKKRTQCALCKWVKPGWKRPYKSWLELIFPLSLQQAHLWWKVCCEKVHLGKLLGWERIIWNLAFFLGIFLEPGFHFRERIPGCFNQLEPRSGCWFCLACCFQVGNEIYCTASAPSKSWENENENTEVSPKQPCTHLPEGWRVLALPIPLKRPAFLSFHALMGCRAPPPLQTGVLFTSELLCCHPPTYSPSAETAVGQRPCRNIFL